VIDIHSHILPALDDGARDWEESLEMARLAVKDGIRVMVATPHLFPKKVIDQRNFNNKEIILEKIRQFKKKLSEADLALEIIPGCDIHLCFESLQLLDQDQIMTINDQKRYLLLELSDTSFPPAIESICFQLQSKGVTPIITHPERHLIIQDMPEKLTRLLELGCLAQVTGTSLLGGFGRQIAKFSRKLVKKGAVQILASDAHDTEKRPPALSEAVKVLAGLIGEERARAMVTTIPDKIIKGEPCF
jgi:protein-tyrosine phosphatase